jgi:DNA-binding GntR family transcriptional regulator
VIHIIIKKLADNHSLPYLIKEEIVNKIMQGALKAGDKLTETEYAEEYGTSRGPIRDAFSLLLSDGFVQKFPRRGTVVKGYTLDEIQDLLDIRNLLEILALEKIKSKDQRAYLDKMNLLIAEMEQKQDQTREYAKLNYEFHYQIIIASESSVIINAYDRLGAPLLSIQSFSLLDTQNINKSLEEHKQIVHYLEEKNIEKAENILSSHNKYVFTRIEKALSK